MSEFVTKKEFETWKKNLETRKSVGAIMAKLLHHQGADYVNPLLQYGNVATAGTANVTFDIAYKTGTTPIVIGCTDDQLAYFACTAVSNTGFTGKSFNPQTNTIRAATIYWLAIGDA
jgi:hypothetical protein